MNMRQIIYIVSAVVALVFAGSQPSFGAGTDSAANSVYNWGSWDTMVSPASGPEEIDVSPLSFNLPEDYVPEKYAEGRTVSLRGFGVTRYYSSSGDGDMTPWAVTLRIDKEGNPAVTDWSSDNFPDAEYYSNETRYMRYSDSEKKDIGDIEPNGVISLLGGDLRDGSVQSTGKVPFYYPSAPNFPVEPAEDYDYYYIENVTDIERKDGTEKRTQFRVNLTPVLGEGSGGPYIVTLSTKYTDVDLTCADGCDETFSENIEGAFIVGTPTATSDIADRINEGRAVAHYSGRTLFAGYASFEMDVDFGQGTWNAAVNGGSDGPVYINSDNNHVSGRVGWRASGDVVGATFVSTAVSADDGTVSGFVQGGFFNPDATAVTGVADLTKSRADAAYTNAKHVVGFVGLEEVTPQ
jgi:hypothetical protein